MVEPTQLRPVPAFPLEKLPPSNIDAEQSVIGSLLIDEDAVLVVGERLQPADFFRDSHRLVYQAMLRLRGSGTPADIVTVTNELERRNELAQAGGAAYLHSLATVVPTAVHVAHYAEIVRETAQHRRLISLGGRVAGMGYDETVSSADGIAQAEGWLMELLQERADRGGHISSITIPKELSERPMPLAHPRLAKILRGGFRPGVSYVVAGVPGGHKTGFMLDAELCVLLACYGVVHITNELPGWVMRERYLAHLGEYDLGHALENHLEGWEIEARERAELQLNMMPLFVFESIPNVDEIGLRMAKAKAQERNNVKGWLLVIDYIQRLRGDQKAERRHVISDNFDRLQEIARNEGVALIVASSLPKGDLKLEPWDWGGSESGDIKGFTSVFLGLQRDKEADALTPGRLNVKIYVTKNTLGPETVIDYQVAASSLQWTELDRMQAIPSNSLHNPLERPGGWAKTGGEQ